MSPQVEKQQFKNQDDGYVGAVTVSPKGDEKAVALAPGEEIFLSEAEQILTANAPRKAQDNPFLPQTRITTDPETGAKVEVQVTPLIPISDERFVPANHRPIPGDEGMPRATDPLDSVPPVAPVDPAVPPTPVPAGIGALQGQDTPPAEPEPTPEAPPVPQIPEPPARAAQAAAQAQQAEIEAEDTNVPEEVAQKSPGVAHEETGAAVAPTGDAEEGEYAKHEEVGTPEAPAQQPTPPAPYTPPEE